MDLPVVSVVVIGRNEGQRLVRCLTSVIAMRPPPGEVEIIYVDSASTDGSPERARSMGVQVIELQATRPTAAMGRNAGWRQSRAPVVFFLDGDTLLDPHFVSDSLSQFDDEKVAVVWGHRRELGRDHSLYSRVLDLDFLVPAGASEWCGGDALMRRSALEEVGGYDQTLIAGEEPDLCRRLRGRGYVIWHVDHLMTEHELGMTRFHQYWRRATRSGHAYAEVSARYRGTDIPLWDEDARRNLRNGTVLLLTFGLALAGAVLLRNVGPILLAGAAFGALVLRTAIRCRSKCPDFGTRLWYGLHSQFQQIPLLVGQLTYWRHRLAGSKQVLIEYK